MQETSPARTALRGGAAARGGGEVSERTGMTEANAALRIVAADWSGDRTEAGQRKKIWIADDRCGALELIGGITRAEAARWLAEAALATPGMVVGLDFAFSFPAWFLRELGCPTAHDFWQVVAGQGEQWLGRQATGRNGHLWGRPGCQRPAEQGPPLWLGLRKTDRDFRVNGITPKSPFQVGGAGSVGAGSIRGIALLPALAEAGFSVWPFDEPRLPLLLEIYPRLFTGPGAKSSRAFRERWLAEAAERRWLPPEVLRQAAVSEDAFDALGSALGMRLAEPRLRTLERVTDPEARLEGRIWYGKTCAQDG